MIGNRMDMKRNTVSIVMCTYNGESFIREQLDSIMAQTYPVEEIIIQDDCSTDGTFEVVSGAVIRIFVPYVIRLGKG